MGEVLDEVELANGARVAVTAKAPNVELRLSQAGRRERITLPYPAKGIGGGRLVLSPSAKYVILSLYSGQSEEGYEVFELSPELRHLGGLPYILGEGSSYAFSANERSFVMVYPGNCLGMTADDLADAKRDASGYLLPGFGGLVVHDLVSGTKPTCVILARVAPDYEPIEEAVNAEDFQPRFIGESHVQFVLPWGLEVQVRMPLPEEVVVEGPPG